MTDLKPLFKSEYKDNIIIIAGPCSAESRELTLDVAKSLSAFGIHYFRAGVWKPRTSPGSFEGVGDEALSWLMEAKEMFGIVPLTEVATSEHLHKALEAGLRDFWIGARTSSDPFAVQKLADRFEALSNSLKDEITVLIKNPLSPDTSLWVGAIQRIYNSGIRRIGAVFRGFSAYGPRKFRNMPDWRVPVELSHLLPGLPIICDPSHISGKAELVEEVSRLAILNNFDGLMIESHPCPDIALSDARQQITPTELHEIICRLDTSVKSDVSEILNVYRSEIDTIDEEIISLLARRMDISRHIGTLKKEFNIPVVSRKRYNEMMDYRLNRGDKIGLSQDFLTALFSNIHAESVHAQIALRKKVNNI